MEKENPTTEPRRSAEFHGEKEKMEPQRKEVRKVKKMKPEKEKKDKKGKIRQDFRMMQDGEGEQEKTFNPGSLTLHTVIYIKMNYVKLKVLY